MKISDPTRRLLLLAAGAFALVGGGVAVSSFVLDDGDPGLAATSSAGADYRVRDVFCGTNLGDEPLATGNLVNVSDTNHAFRVVVTFSDGERDVGHGSKLLDELPPGADDHWAVWGTKEFNGSGLDCDVRVEAAT